MNETEMLLKSANKMLEERFDELSSVKQERDTYKKLLQEEHDNYVNLNLGEMSYKHKNETCDVCEALREPK